MILTNLAKTAAFSGALLSTPLALELSAERDTADILVDVLVRKGILTESEAITIRDEVAAVAADEKKKVVESAVAAATHEFASVSPVSAVPMPKALDGLKLYGDARFRFQAEDVDDADIRERWRYRARFGADYGFKESPFSMGLRLETSKGNDSTNASFGGFFDKVGDELYLGLVYLNYEGENASVSLGKHKQPFTLDGAFWDGDVNPEGLSETFSAGPVTLRFGQYIIDEGREDKGGSDDFLFVAQAEWSNDAGLTLAPIFLTTTDGDSTVSDGGSFAGENAIRYFRHFDVIALPVEYAFATGDGVKQSLFGTVGVNLSADDAVAHMSGPYYNAVNAGDQDLFYNIGYQYGSAKKAGSWQAGVEFRHIQGASYTPNLSDSDFAKNSLNHEGFVLTYKYALTDFLVAGVTYMDSDLIDSDYVAPVVAKDDVKILQLDAAVKF